MTNQPDMSNFFLTKLMDFASEMQIMYELEKAVAGNEHPICLGIKDCIQKKLPVEIILSNIRGMATTNFNAIADHIGISLTEKILAK